MLLRRGMQKLVARGSAILKKPLGNVRLSDSWMAGTVRQSQVFNKDKKAEDEEEEDEEFRKKSYKEEWQNFWKDPKKKGGLLLSVAVLGTLMFSSTKFRDILGLDFGFYRKLRLEVYQHYLGVGKAFA